MKMSYAAYCDLSDNTSITADTIRVIYDGTPFTCDKTDAQGDAVYGAPGDDNNTGNYDFSEYPFQLLSQANDGGNRLYIDNDDTAQSHTIEVEGVTSSVITTECFEEAVKSVSGGGGGGAKNVWYGTCSSDPSSATTMVIDTTTGDFTNAVGNIITVLFINGLEPFGYYEDYEIDNTIYNLGSSVTGYEEYSISGGMATVVSFVVTDSSLNTIMPIDDYTLQYVDNTVSEMQTHIKSITPTLTVSGWSSNTQTATVSGVTSSNNVIVTPAPASIADYTSAGIYCSAQGTNTLTFTCATVPSTNITVNVLIVPITT